MVLFRNLSEVRIYMNPQAMERPLETKMMPAPNETGIHKITESCNRIYESGYIPENMQKSTFFPLNKKPKPIHCTDLGKLDCQAIEPFDLGELITDHGKNEQGIHRRMQLATNIFYKLHE